MNGKWTDGYLFRSVRCFFFVRSFYFSRRGAAKLESANIFFFLRVFVCSLPFLSLLSFSSPPEKARSESPPKLARLSGAFRVWRRLVFCVAPVARIYLPAPGNDRESIREAVRFRLDLFNLSALVWGSSRIFLPSSLVVLFRSGNKISFMLPDVFFGIHTTQKNSTSFFHQIKLLSVTEGMSLFFADTAVSCKKQSPFSSDDGGVQHGRYSV